MNNEDLNELKELKNQLYEINKEYQKKIQDVSAQIDAKRKSVMEEYGDYSYSFIQNNDFLAKTFSLVGSSRELIRQIDKQNRKIETLQEQDEINEICTDLVSQELKKLGTQYQFQKKIRAYRKELKEKGFYLGQFYKVVVNDVEGKTVDFDPDIRGIEVLYFKVKHLISSYASNSDIYSITVEIGIASKHTQKTVWITGNEEALKKREWHKL